MERETREGDERSTVPTQPTVSVRRRRYTAVTSPPREPRTNRAVGRMCARHPYSTARCGFSAALPPLPAGPHEIRAFVRDAAGKVKDELG